MPYAYLFIAILSEVVATSFMKESDGFTRLGPSLITLVGYGIAFNFLSLTLRDVPTGVAYAIWSGVGIVLIAAVRSEEHTSELQSLMRISYAVFCLKKKKRQY